MSETYREENELNEVEFKLKESAEEKETKASAGDYEELSEFEELEDEPEEVNEIDDEEIPDDADMYGDNFREE